MPLVGKLPGTRFVVDEFRPDRNLRSPSGKIYFLSHFHSDHYTGITAKWAAGPIYCTDITARLLSLVLEVHEQWIRPIDVEVTHEIDGHNVTCIDANHCPGAVVFVIETQSGTRLLHTGDFRATETLAAHSAIIAGPVDTIYLDTTYCHPKHELPPQSHCVEFIARKVEEILTSSVRTLVLVATYTIGKEKILIEIAKRCQTKIVIEPRKLAILSQLNLFEAEEMKNVFTVDQSQSDVRVLRWGQCGESAPGGWTFHPDFPALHDMMRDSGQDYEEVALFVPTGWTYGFSQQDKPQRLHRRDNSSTSEELEIVHTVQKSGKATAWMVNYRLIESCMRSLVDRFFYFQVPYSEHSSYSELRDFVGKVKPRTVVPTVAPPSVSMARIMSTFRDLVDNNASKKHFIAKLFRISGESSRKKKRLIEIKQLTPTGDDTFKKEKSKDVTKDEQKVSCPCCGELINGDHVNINKHIDKCLTRSASSCGASVSPTVSPATSQSIDVPLMSPASSHEYQKLKQCTLKSMFKDTQTNEPSSCNTDEDIVKLLLSLLPAGTKDQQAITLLRKADGSIEKAVNLFFDS